MKLEVAVLGASGFIGSRIVEMFHLGGLFKVRPVVRSFASLARLSRFDLDWQIADALDETALRKAFEGCEVVIHAVLDYSHRLEKTILGSVAASYTAAEATGVRRFIYISTASVHGQAPLPGTDETSLLNDRQAIQYNNLKVRAEKDFLKLREKGSVELVILRPAIVIGPRSAWVKKVADELLEGTGYLINEGKGICNSIYVDNLVHAIRLAMLAANADGEAFLVGDREEVTWLDFYRTIAEALGLDTAQIHQVDCPNFNRTWRSRLIDWLETTSPRKSVQRVFLDPDRIRRLFIKVLSSGLRPPASSRWTLPSPKQPVVTHDMVLLHQCQYKFPYKKAQEVLGYQPIVSFREGMHRCIGWMDFVGYPVRRTGTREGMVHGE